MLSSGKGCLRSSLSVRNPEKEETNGVGEPQGMRTARNKALCVTMVTACRNSERQAQDRVVVLQDPWDLCPLCLCFLHSGFVLSSHNPLEARLLCDGRSGERGTIIRICMLCEEKPIFHKRTKRSTCSRSGSSISSTSVVALWWLLPI